MEYRFALSWIRPLVVVLCLGPWASSLAAQGNAAPVRGAEFGAAVNLVAKNVRAEGRIFVPEGVRRVRAVLVLINVYHGEGVFYDEGWRRLVETCECASVYLNLASIRALPDNLPVATQPMRHAGMGGADALLLLMDRLGRESGHEELRDAPMVLWGWSAGAAFSSSFAELHPERVAAFIRYHIHRRGVAEDLKVLSSVPALLIAGGKDQAAGTQDAEELWRAGRSAGAPWAFAIEPDAPHGPSEEFLLQSCHDLVVPWIRGVLRERLEAGRSKPRRIPQGSGWLANNQTADIAPQATFAGVSANASWLPDERTARGWQIVVRGNR